MIDLIAGAVAAIIIAAFLVGIRLMQSPETAVKGYRLGSLAMALAILLALRDSGAISLPTIP